MNSEPLIVLGSLIQRAGNTVVKNNRIALGDPVSLTVGGDFTMTNSVHELSPSGFIASVDNIFGAEAGELLLLYGDRVRLRSGNGNIALSSNFWLLSGRSVLLYYTGTVWVAMSITT